MTFTVVIPSYLAPYAGAAHNREGKLLRAVNSVLSQSFTDFEVIVIADGCERTMEILSGIEDKRLIVHKIAHRKLWSGYPRNKGIDVAKGQYLIYLDIDDLYGKAHLETVAKGLNGYDWVWYNDIRFKPSFNLWYENECDIRTIGRHGTSNICHKPSLGVRWDEEGRYAHDYYFVRKLLEFKNHTKVTTPEYYVCHVPGTFVSGGYDV